ncbi:MAG: hypothetical protein JWM40_1955, partial [Frankiales bacterium]|nr:hypothetical protein [Frankiales bacterium]
KTCLGVASPPYLASDPGRSFTKGDLEVDSSADVAATLADGKAELAAYTGPKSTQCFKAQLVKVFAAEGASVTSFVHTPVTLTVPGADAVFGYELSVDATGGGQTLQLRGFDLGTLVGQVEVSVSVFGTPQVGLTLDEAQALLVKATARAKAAL